MTSIQIQSEDPAQEPDPGEMKLWEQLDSAEFIEHRDIHEFRDAGIETVEDVFTTSVFEMAHIDGIDEELAERVKFYLGDLTVVKSVGKQRASLLLRCGFDPQKADEYSVDELTQVPTVGEPIAKNVLAMGTESD